MNTPTDVVPADFPRGVLSALAGVQPKLSVRLIDGKYVAGWTADELRCRHANSEDIVQHLVIYSQRKDIENPDWTHQFNLGRTERALASKGRSGEWDVTVDEQAWIMVRLRALLG
jgi:hypothetical protein